MILHRYFSHWEEPAWGGIEPARAVLRGSCLMVCSQASPANLILLVPVKILFRHGVSSIRTRIPQSRQTFPLVGHLSSLWDLSPGIPPGTNRNGRIQYRPKGSRAWPAFQPPFCRVFTEARSEGIVPAR